MTKDHKWHIVVPTYSANDCEIYLNDEKFELPVTRMNVDITAGEPVRVTAVTIPRRLDALLTFSEENPLVVEIHWPQCPHCGKFYDKESMPAKLTIPPGDR